MRTALLTITTLAIIAPSRSASDARFLTRPASAAAPCTKATTECEQWILIRGGPSRTKLYASHPLDVANPAIVRALVMVHGAGRNADHYFETSTGAAFLAGALDNTIIIAPRFAAGNDKVAKNEVLWPERGENWRSGGALSDGLDVRFVRSHGRHSAHARQQADFSEPHQDRRRRALRRRPVRHALCDGEQGTRQAERGRGELRCRQPVELRVASRRARAPERNADPATADKEALGPNGEKVNGEFTYGPFDSTKAPSYNRWPAGLANRTGYTAGMSDDQLRRQLVERPTTYLLGQVDVLPLGGFDSSPNAMAQGPTRRARGEAFFKYVNEVLGAKHRAIIVPECGHNDRCIYTTDLVFPVIFPK